MSAPLAGGGVGIYSGEVEGVNKIELTQSGPPQRDSAENRLRGGLIAMGAP